MDAEQAARVRRMSIDKIRSEGKHMNIWKRLLIANIYMAISGSRKRRLTGASATVENKKICK